MWQTLLLLAGSVFLVVLTESSAIPAEHFPGGPRGADNGTANGTEIWGYVEVREKAHMFWWLYKTYHVDGYLNRPWIIWLQGGPGSSSCGYGNFELLGPLHVDLNTREHTWVHDVNVLFLDQPIGTGYSYAEDISAFATTNTQVALDMVTWIKTFLINYPEFQTIPLYIFGESYGGKMGSEFALELEKAKQRGEVTVDLRGQANGNSWISPEDSTLEWAGLSYYTGLTDQKGYDAIMEQALATQDAIANGAWSNATDKWVDTEIALFARTDSVDIYYYLNFTGVPPRNLEEMDKEERYAHVRDKALDRSPQVLNLNDIMNNEIRQKLGIIPDNVTWDGQGDLVFNRLDGDFMKPVIDVFDEILTTTDLELIIYQGSLDIICLGFGAWRYINKMTWAGLADFLAAPRRYYENPNNLDVGEPWLMYMANGNMKYYDIPNAGHMVPRDVPLAARELLRRIVFDVDR